MPPDGKEVDKGRNVPKKDWLIKIMVGSNAARWRVIKLEWAAFEAELDLTRMGPPMGIRSNGRT